MVIQSTDYYHFQMKHTLLRLVSKLCLLFVLLYCNVTFAQETPQEISGDVLATALPLVALGSTFIYKNGDKGTSQFIKSAATTFLLTHSLKRLIDKPRPNGGKYSFPSGHTSSAFTGAAFLQRRYGWAIGVPAYAAASYVGYTRVRARKHDIYDVVAGAAIGVGSVYLFTKPFKNEKLHLAVSTTTFGGYRLTANLSI